MPAPRRSAIVAVLVLLAGFAFAACGRAQPGTAFYIGGTRYTEEQINEIVDEVRPLVAAENIPIVRDLAVNGLVLRDLGRLAAKEKSVDVPAADYAGIARRLQLSEDFKIVHVIADSDAAALALIKVTNPVQATDKDLREIYELMRRTAGDRQSQPSYEELAVELRADADLPIKLGLRDALVEQAKKVGVKVNPRYLPLTASLAEVPVPLADGVGVAVEDI